ncbi:MAG: hypothetical protein ABIP75_02085, partial [Pyrinomonadaceae bacterium]
MADLAVTIMKFGGTSVEDVAAIERLVGIVSSVYRSKISHPVVVVSALSGVTNALLASFDQATAGDPAGAAKLLAPQWERHLAVARALTQETATIIDLLETSRREITELLQAAAAETRPRPLRQDEIVSYGEMLSANLLATVLRHANLPAQLVDARRCIITNDDHGNAEPLPTEIQVRTRAELDPLIAAAAIPVLGGFVGATVDGVTTTLGRGGSDYTAALLGAALAANEVQIWTDVTGVLTA